jgi:hypothetical protein
MGKKDESSHKKGIGDELKEFFNPTFKKEYKNRRMVYETSEPEPQTPQPSEETQGTASSTKTRISDTSSHQIAASEDVVDWRKVLNAAAITKDKNDIGNVVAAKDNSIIIKSQDKEHEYNIPKARVEAYSKNELFLDLNVQDIRAYQKDDKSNEDTVVSRSRIVPETIEPEPQTPGPNPTIPSDSDTIG